MHELSHVGILQGDNLATQLGQGRTPCSAVQHAPSAYLAAFTDHPVLNLGGRAAALAAKPAAQSVL